MKVKYRVLESRYSDGSVRFFPQSYDWWHGWRFYANSQWSDFDNRGPGIRIWFDTLEKAETFLTREIEWLKIHDPKKEAVVDGYIHQVKEIIHKYNGDKKKQGVLT